MAIHKQVFRDSGKNGSAIPSGSDWAGCYRVRMTESQRDTYGACNTFRFHNQSGEKVQVRFGWNNEGGEPYYEMESNSILNLTVEDGILSYGFDIVNLDGANDVSASEFVWTMSRVEQIPEGR
jgi:hypothetical protein